MAGHSKWANIKHRKGAQDAKRGKIFTKMIKEITVAAREGGGEPDTNPRLRLAIQNAKGVNMPKDNIERAIKKATGEGGAVYTEPTYEGYGPHGVAVYVETATDNTNRTVSNVRSYFSKYGGSLGTSGSLDFIFDRKGIFSFKAPEDFDQDEFELEIIDAGVEEIEIEDGYVTITCEMTDFGNVNKALEEMGIEAENAELSRIPKTSVSVDDEQFVQLAKLINALEDDDDVQKVFHNIELTEGQMEQL